MKYVAYYRVSTQQQGNSGLGLEAQRTAVLSYIKRNGNHIIAEFTEVESGKKDDRPELIKAINCAKENEAVLVIAKLDRLSRNLTFISQLMEGKVKFICCDMPEASELTIHIFAALAQWERKRISERTKEALAAKRVREPDWKPGTPNLTEAARQRAHEAVKRGARTDQKVRHAYHYIKTLKEQGLSYQKIADKLNEEGYMTRRDRKFRAMQVYDIWTRFEVEKIPVVINRTDLFIAAQELNRELGLSPKIRKNLTSEKLIEKLQLASKWVMPEDDLSKVTLDVLAKIKNPQPKPTQP